MVVDRDGHEVGRVDAVELVTVGQRKGLGLRGGDGAPRYVVDVDVSGGTVTVGDERELLDRGDDIARGDVVRQRGRRPRGRRPRGRAVQRAWSGPCRDL